MHQKLVPKTKHFKINRIKNVINLKKIKLKVITTNKFYVLI